MTAAGARTNAYTTDDFTNYHVTFAKEDLETILAARGDRFQNLVLPGAGVPDRGARGARRVQQERAEPVRKLIEVQREHAFTPTPTSTRRWASSRTSRTCRTSSSTRRPSSTAGTGPENTTIIVAGDVTPEQVIPLVEKHWGALEARQLHSARSRGAGAAGARLRARALDGADAALGDGRLPRPRVLGRRRRTSRRVDLLLDLTFGPTSDLYKRLVEHEQKVDQLFPYLPAQRGPVPGHASRAREEGRGRGLRARRDPRDVRPMRARRRCPRSASRTRSRTRATASSARLDNTERDRVDRWRASCATAARSTR